MSSVTEKITFYDPIVEDGHKEFNYLFKLKYDCKGSFESKIKPNLPFIGFHLYSFVYHYRFLKKAKENDVFLIFNNLSLFLITFLIRDVKCNFIVHNNLDFALKSKIHKFFYKRIASKVNLIYLEDRLKKRAEYFFNHKSVNVIAHPVIDVDLKIKEKTPKVFVSSRNLTEREISLVCNMEHTKKVLCNKKLLGVEIPNLEMGFIEDFDTMLNECSKVYIVGNYKNRASGILYKALSISGIEIVFSDETYYNEIVQLISKGIIESKSKIILNNKINC
ncbi:hypothetical protein [Tenacibaculum sp. 190524A02b]|uniref:hypothetical protein n=1 Tax=Tenacibaculum vairaonense TaxID=3137860 RepID=UPI0031FADB71